MGWTRHYLHDPAVIARLLAIVRITDPDMQAKVAERLPPEASRLAEALLANQMSDELTPEESQTFVALSHQRGSDGS